MPTGVEGAQKTRECGVPNGEGPSGKLSLKERKSKTWIVRQKGRTADRGNGGMARASQPQGGSERLSFPTTFLPLSLLLGYELEGERKVE